MRFALDDDQLALRDGLRELLTGECPPDTVRAAWATPGGEPARVTDLWRSLAEMGIPGTAVPESAGGLGLGPCELVALLEETGRAAVPLPVMETCFVAAPLLAAGADAGGERLQRLLAGELIVAASLDGSPLVPWAAVAGGVLVSDAADSGREIRWLDAAGATRPAVVIDHARTAGILEPGAPVAPLGITAADCVAAWWRGVLGCAAQLIGLARRLLDLTAEYVRERRQFGVPIGSFQALKHHLADALIAVEFAAPAVMRAAWSMQQSSSDTARDVAMAKALASDAALSVAKVALQCHGAIAYTTEYDFHLYAKRVWATAPTWGTADRQRAVVADSLGLGDHRSGGRPS